jgi:hypothetical protein
LYFAFFIFSGEPLNERSQVIEMKTLPEKYADKIVGVLNCYDRILITGTLVGFCYPEGMTAHLYAQGIRIFDFTKFASPFRDQIRMNAETIAKEKQPRNRVYP